MRLFSGRAISQLRFNLSRAANVPLFGLHKQASAPRSLPALSLAANNHYTSATTAKQSPEQPSTRAAMSTPTSLLKATCLLPGASPQRFSDLEAVPHRLEHSLSNLEVLRTLGAACRPRHDEHVYSKMVVPASVPKRLGGRVAGTGTFGRVRLVRCRLTGRFLALKALKKAEILRMRQEHSVHKEKQILASLQHPFIVRMCVTALGRKTDFPAICAALATCLLCGLASHC